MGIFARLKTAIAAQINALIGKFEKPEKMLDQAIIDMNEQLLDSRKAVAQAIADEKKLKRSLEAQKEKSAEWEKKAMLAVNAGKDDLATEALLRKQESDKFCAEYEKQWQTQYEAVNKLKISLGELVDKIDEAKRKKDLLVARARGAEARQKIHDTMSGMQVGRAGLDTFERMEKKVDELEAQAEASVELRTLGTDSSLEKRFEELEKASTDSDKLLSDLKAKMGIISANAPPRALPPPP